MESRLEKAIKKITELGLIDSFIENKLEQAYIKQLKKEAFERFGEIKDGDRFDLSVLGYLYGEYGEIHFIPNAGYEKGFTYNKDDDMLYFDNLVIYKQGKWATRVKESVKVEFRDHVAVGNYDYHSHSFTIDVLRNAKQFDPEKAGQFLASQLEKYLNGEIE